MKKLKHAPTPPGFGWQILRFELVAHLRAPLIAGLLCKILWPLWTEIVAWANVSDVTMFVVTTTVVHFFMWSMGVFVFMYLGDKRGWFQAHRMPRTSAMTPPAALIKEAATEAVTNQLLSTPLLLYIVGSYIIKVPTQLGPEIDAGACPSIGSLYLMFLGAMVMNEIGFYSFHRLFHEVPYLYQNFHKKHHAFHGTVSIAAEYVHPFEEVFANTLSTVGFVLYMRVPVLVWMIWLAQNLMEVEESHSGYCFDKTWLARIGLLGSTRARHHDFHHTVNQGNYGNPLLDWTFGTMGAFITHNKLKAI